MTLYYNNNNKKKKTIKKNGNKRMENGKQKIGKKPKIEMFGKCQKSKSLGNRK